ncbi:MAG: hypothetical protein GX994_08570 [Firmicutes bacterium]|nr:hypothetical protein [Bacillota bacterium]
MVVVTIDNLPQFPQQNQNSDNLCAMCRGDLLIECSCTEGFGFDNAYVDCPYCEGTGTTHCPNCNDTNLTKP